MPTYGYLRANNVRTVTYKHVLHIHFYLIKILLRTRTFFPDVQFSLLKNPENRYRHSSHYLDKLHLLRESLLIAAKSS